MGKLQLQDVEETQTGKVWYKSRTIWLGILSVVSGSFSAVAELLPILQLDISSKTYSLLLFFFGVGAIVLRLATDEVIKKNVES